MCHLDRARSRGLGGPRTPRSCRRSRPRRVFGARAGVDVDALYPLPADSASPAWARVIELRAAATQKNERDELKSLRLLITARTRLYSMMYRAVSKTAPLLAREMLTQCEMTVFGRTCYDGPLAWNLALHPLTRTERTPQDKDYYRIAEDLYRKNKLPGGCDPAAFSKRVLNFITHVWPNQTTRMSREAAGDFILDMMPDSDRCRMERYRLREKLIESGRLGDLMHVQSLARAIVYDETKGRATPTPVMASLTSSDCFGFQPAALADTTGISLAAFKSLSIAPSPAAPAAPGGDGGKKWCPACPHLKRDGSGQSPCFCGPDYTSALPASIYLDAERRRGIYAQRRQNGCPALPDPRRNAIDAAKKRKADAEARAAKKGAGGAAAAAADAAAGGAKPGGVAVDGGAVAAASGVASGAGVAAGVGGGVMLLLQGITLLVKASHDSTMRSTTAATSRKISLVVTACSLN